MEALLFISRSLSHVLYLYVTFSLSLVNRERMYCTRSLFISPPLLLSAPGNLSRIQYVHSNQTRSCQTRRGKTSSARVCMSMCGLGALWKTQKVHWRVKSLSLRRETGIKIFNEVVQTGLIDFNLVGPACTAILLKSLRKYP